MSWDDWLLGGLTGGIYNVGKATTKAGEAADAAGTALAAIGSTVTKLGTDISSFLKELEELITINRVAPRTNDDLWDEEVERLNALRKRENELVAELTSLSANDDDDSWFESFWKAIFGGMLYEELVVRTKLAAVRDAIREILYEEPGVIPTSIHNFQLILERFNTLEQPRLEEILDSLNNNLDASEEILQEVKKLFVVKTWKAVPLLELPVEKRKDLEILEASIANFDTLIKKNTGISAQLQHTLVQVQPTEFKMAGISKTSGGAGYIPPIPNPLLKGSDATGDNRPSKEEPMLHAALASGSSFALKNKFSAIAAQPMAASVATALNQNVVAGYLDNYHVIEGRVRYYLRERVKLEKAIFRIKYVPVEGPGVIPKILEETEQTIARFRTESQPRFESMLDNVNATVVESKAVLANFNKSLQSVQGVFDYLTKYSLYVKIGMCVAATLMLLILVMSLIVLFRLAFGM